MPSQRLSQAPDRGLLGSPPSRDTAYIALDCTNHRHASAGPGRSGTAPRPTLSLLPHAHRMVSALAPFVLATMSAALPARQPVSRRVHPPGAGLLASPPASTRPSSFPL